MWVLDSSAIIALLMDEPGAERVTAVLPESVVSTVNLAEVVGVLLRKKVPADIVRRTLDALRLVTVPLSEDAAFSAGLLEPRTRALGLSLGDRACIALAAEQRATILTTDQAMASYAGSMGLATEAIR